MSTGSRADLQDALTGTGNAGLGIVIEESSSAQMTSATTISGVGGPAVALKVGSAAPSALPLAVNQTDATQLCRAKLL